MNWQDVLNKSFDKIYVVTLLRAQDRHQLVKSELSGVDFEFFYGVDKLNITKDEAIESGVYSSERTKKENRYYSELSLGQIACSWSHLTLYRQIVEKGYKKVLIFEDDVVVIRKEMSKLQRILEEVPSDWDLLYLGYRKHWRITSLIRIKQIYYQVIGALRITAWDAKMYQNYYAKPYSKHIMRAGFHDYTHAYAITTEGARKLIEYQTPIAFSADTLLAYAVMKGKVKGYISCPKLFNQEGGTSYINSINVDE